MTDGIDKLATMATLDAVTTAADRLSRVDQRRLLAHLQAAIVPKSGNPVPVDSARKRYDVLEAVLCEIIGEETLVTRCRRRPVAWARHILAYQMRTEGYTSVEISRCLERDHSTILNSWQQVDAMLSFPDAYPEEMSMLVRLRRAIGGRAR